MTFLGVKVAHVLAGLAGGAVRAWSRKQALLPRITTTTIGALVAGYGTPVATHLARHYLSAFGEIAGLEGLCGFMLGLVGMSLAEGALRIVRRWASDPRFPPAPDAS